MTLEESPGEADVEHLWSEHEQRRLTRLCAVITGDPGAADDLAQETLLEAWRHRDGLVDPSGQRAWLDAIARNVCRRWRVRRGRLAAHEVVSEHPGEHPAAPYDGHDELVEVLEREEVAELLERALRLLPSETRDALVARYVDERGLDDIAARLGTSSEAVSMRLTRGRRRIRELLETDLADEPLAQAWVSRHGVAWRPTRVACAHCGRPSTSIRRDGRGGVVELRCDSCEPDGLGSSWRLDNPALAPALNAVTRPSAIVSRMASWCHGFWPAAIESGTVACTRCGTAVAVLPYARPGAYEPHTQRGWYVSCAACGEEMSTSLLGLVLSYPEARDLRAVRPRAHAVPTRHEHLDGRRVLVVGLRDDASGDVVEMLFDDATTRVLGVVATR
jgi:RNA polymerase sigma factor (sigma-70 family)